jgi:CubicO group peptidase (beta-lactamase class C family)
MRKLITLIGYLFFIGYSFGQTVQNFTHCENVENIGFAGNRINRIDSLLSQYVKDKKLPNAIALVIKDGQIVYSGAYGYKDVENKIIVKSDDIFRNASQTKAITSAVLLSLFEEGKFKLDDPIEKYLPMFANPQVYESGDAKEGTLKTRPAKRSITIRHLLTHTAGYDYNPYGQEVEGFFYRYPITSQEVLERMAKIPLQHDPGEKFTYGFSTDIAGYLAEAIGGKTLDVLMRERILDPLGMKDTYFVQPQRNYDRLVKLYTQDAGTNSYQLTNDQFAQDAPKITYKTALCGGAGLSGTIEDYARFCQMILNGGEFNNQRVLGRQTVELMTSSQMEGVETYHDFSMAFELTNKYRYNKCMVPPNSLKWGGAFGTDYIIDRKNNMILLFYTNINQTYNDNVSMHEAFHISVYQSMK